MKGLIALLILCTLSACSTVATVATPDDYYTQKAQRSAPEPLFDIVQDGLSPEQIEFMLSHRLVLPQRLRLALLALPGGGYSRGYFDSVGTSQLPSQASKIVLQLRQSPRLYDASFLPRLLIPAKRSIGSLRAAAARYRADLLLVYQPNCNTFHQYRAFRADQVKANCAVEIVLLDTRTGLVPFTAVANQAFMAQKKEGDLNFAETVSNAETRAINQALNKAATSLIQFIEKVPVQE